MKRYRLYTGPTLVQHVAQELRSKGFEVLEGTENVYFNSNLEHDELYELLNLRGRFRYNDLWEQ